MHTRFFRYIWILIAVLFLFPTSCKKGIVTPENLPVIWTNLNSLAFTAAELGPNPADQFFIIKNTGIETLSYSLSDDADFYDHDWLTITPLDGNSSGQENQHNVVIDKTSLIPRTEPYICKIKIVSSNCYNSPQYIDVSLSISEQKPGIIAFSPDTFDFEATVGGPNPKDQTLSIQNAGELPLNYKIEADKKWLQIIPATGTLENGHNDHIVKCDINGLKKGTRSANVTISDPNASNSPQTLTVTLTLNENPPPTIEVFPQELEFIGKVGGANPLSQTVEVSNIGDGTLRYLFEWDAAWMTVNPASGKSAGAAKAHTVKVDTAGMAEGEYTGSISVSDPIATNDPVAIPVKLTLTKTAPPPPPPPPDNQINISVSPGSGGIDTVVTVKIGINGNASVLSDFGFDLNFDASAFSYMGFTNGSLTSSWGSVWLDSLSGGVAKFRGSNGTIPINSTGTIVEIQLRVIGGSGSKAFSISAFTGGIADMTPAPGSTSFNIQ